MKKFSTFIMLLAFGTINFTSCSSSKNSTKDILGGSTVGGTVVKTVATVVGLILLSKIIKSVLGTVGGSTAFSGLSQSQNFSANFTEDTKLNSFAKNDLLKTALQVIVSERYQIPLATVANNYNSLVTVGDLATFIGKNASAKALLELK
jgi:hypothetical protein